MTLFAYIAIEDFAEVTSSKRIFLNDYVEKGVPFWRSKEVIEQFKGAEISNELFIAEEKYYNIKNKFGVPACGDILVTSVGTIGVPFLVKDNSPFYFKDGNLTWIKNIADTVDSKYLYLWISSQIGQQTIDNQLIGSSQKALTISALKKIKIPIPPLPTQRKIAKILSNYDDLIENNLKRIKLLEESARLTYEEWFLRFRIDGKKLEIDPETKLPFGWERKNLFDIADVTYGYPFKASQFNSKKEGTPIIRIRNIPSSTTKDYTTEKVGDKYVVNSGDLLVGMDGEFHVNHWSGRQGYLVQRVCNIKTKNSDIFGYFCEAIKPSIKYYEATISGATVAHLGKKHLEEIEIVIPDKGFDHNLNKFNNLLSEKLNLTNQNHFLKEARDILLPRLMTGMIDTDDMDIAV